MEQVVYLIGNPAEHPLTKIGYTDMLQARLSGLKSSSPVHLSVLWLRRGGLAEERVLHTYFSKRWHHGEWFDLGTDPAGAVEAAIEHLGIVMEPATHVRAPVLRRPRPLFSDEDRPEVLEVFDGDPFNGDGSFAARKVYLRIS